MSSTSRARASFSAMETVGCFLQDSNSLINVCDTPDAPANCCWVQPLASRISLSRFNVIASVLSITPAR